MQSMNPANFINVNYSLSSMDTRHFKEAERRGDKKAVPEFAGFETGQGTRDVHFKMLGFTATTTEFAHLRFRFNVLDTILMAKQVSEAANHYLNSMRGKAESWYNLQECYALSLQAEAIFERTQALRNYAIPKHVVERSNRFIDPATVSTFPINAMQLVEGMDVTGLKKILA